MSRFLVQDEYVQRYNFCVPTPFYHLRLAQELINHPGLPAPIDHLLQAGRGEFLFGSTAPDVQVVSGQPRQATHFFNLPILAGDHPAWEVLLAEYPHLGHPERLSAAQVAFLAGYLCHLQADWKWITDIFTPVFGPGCPWATFQERLYYHNVLRAYMDQEAVPGLGAGMDNCLGRVAPDGWLPFIRDHHLGEWRDFLVPQLRSGAATHTVEVFSTRQGRSAPEYQALLASPERMQEEIFTHLPFERIQSYWQDVLDDNTQLLIQYLAFALHQSNLIS